MKELQYVSYILFDAANTLIHKPLLWEKILTVLNNQNIEIPLHKLQYNHKLLSEVIDFPDNTSKDFYTFFNTELLISLGIIPTDELIEELFLNCSYLPWEKFDDTDFLKGITIPVGVLSNFNNKLPVLLHSLFDVKFSDIIVSENLKQRKPSMEFYENAIEMTGCKRENILYVGDSLKLDIIPAKKSGINALLIDRIGFYPKSQFTISSLNELNKI
jgi:FMN phosphatase YigB (HAD superfamily)